MIKRNNTFRKVRPYSYSYKHVVNGYSSIKKNEIMTMLDIDHSTSLMIVRLDGKGLTKQSKADGVINEKFYSTMGYVMREIEKYAKIRFAYSCNDEISLLLEKEYLDERKIENRLEKVLTYLSGYVSSLFTIEWYNQTQEMKVTSFDARALIIDKREVKNYFLSRQRFSIQHFIEYLCNHYQFAGKDYTIKGIDTYLKTVGRSWNSFPKIISYGIIGYHDEGKWVVKEASDFEKERNNFFLRIKE